MNQSIEDIMNGPDYFYCDRYKCRMKKAECVRRQTTPNRHSHEIDYTWVSCKECEQGKSVMVKFRGRISEVRKRRRRPPRMDIIETVEAQRAASVDDKHVVAGLASASKEDEKMAKKERCIVAECENKQHCRGLCVQHYWKWQKNQDKDLGYEPLPSKCGKGVKKKKTALKKKSSVSAEIVPSSEISLSQDIAILETQNKESMQEAAKFIIASVKKDLLGAVFQELRGKPIS